MWVGTTCLSYHHTSALHVCVLTAQSSVSNLSFSLHSLQYQIFRFHDLFHCSFALLLSIFLILTKLNFNTCSCSCHLHVQMIKLQATHNLTCMRRYSTRGKKNLRVGFILFSMSGKGTCKNNLMGRKYLRKYNKLCQAYTAYIVYVGEVLKGFCTTTLVLSGTCVHSPIIISLMIEGLLSHSFSFPFWSPMILVLCLTHPLLYGLLQRHRSFANLVSFTDTSWSFAIMAYMYLCWYGPLRLSNETCTSSNYMYVRIIIVNHGKVSPWLLNWLSLVLLVSSYGKMLVWSPRS